MDRLREISTIKSRWAAAHCSEKRKEKKKCRVGTLPPMEGLHSTALPSLESTPAVAPSSPLTIRDGVTEDGGKRQLSHSHSHMKAPLILSSRKISLIHSLTHISVLSYSHSQPSIPYPISVAFQTEPPHMRAMRYSSDTSHLKSCIPYPCSTPPPPPPPFIFLNSTPREGGGGRLLDLAPSLLPCALPAPSP